MLGNMFKSKNNEIFIAIGGCLSGRPESCTSRQKTVVKSCLHSSLFIYFRNHLS